MVLDWRMVPARTETSGREASIGRKIKSLCFLSH